jgi:hypothetical protein
LRRREWGARSAWTDHKARIGYEDILDLQITPARDVELTWRIDPLETRAWWELGAEFTGRTARAKFRPVQPERLASEIERRRARVSIG